MTLLLLAALLALPPAAAGAEWRTPLYKQSFHEQPGAPVGVNAVAQSADGWLWFAAQEGLYRYDGSQFELTDTVWGQPLLHSYVSTLEVAGEQLWVGYQFGGISVFGHGGARHYQAGQGLPASAVMDIKRAPDGTIWAGGSAFVAYLEGGRWRTVALPQPHGALRALTVSAAGDVWVGCDDAVFHLRPGARVVGAHYALPGFQPRRAFADGRILGGTSRPGLWQFTPATGKLSRVRLAGMDGPALAYSNDARGHLWAASEHKTFLYDEQLRLMQVFDEKHTMSDMGFHMPFEDHEGTLWFASTAGIEQLRQTKLTPLPLPAFTDVPALAYVAYSPLWAGDRRYPLASEYDSSPAIRDWVREVGRYTASHRQRNGVGWYGNASQLVRYGGAPTRHYPLPPALRGFSMQSITSDSRGKLWIAMVRNGVYSFQDGVWRAGDGRDDLGATPLILLSGQQDRLWLGYPNSRVALLERGRLRSFGPADGLDIANVMSFSERNGRLWAGGAKGIAWFDGQRFHPLRDRNGLPYRGVSGIVETANGDLWLHGTDGLIRIHAAALRAALDGGSERVGDERFSRRDGLVGAPPQIRPLPTLLEGPDGKLWYSATAGVGSIDPARIDYNRLPPPVEIRAIKHAGRYWDAGAGPLRFPGGANDVQIDYVGLSYSSPERVRFRYQLDGVDHGWQDVGGRRSAYYTDLAPGSYRFRVLAANEDGVWSPQGAELRFAIAPTLAQTLWFRMALGLLVAGLLWCWHRQRVRKAAAQVHARLEERLGERSRIARELHDTLLQSVQGIILKVEAVAQSVPPELPALRGETRAIVSQAVSALEEGRERVQDLRNRGVAQPRLEEVLRQTAGQIAELHGRQPPAVRVSGTPRALHAIVEEELQAIGTEALLNSHRHAHGAVSIEVAYAWRQLSLTVDDDGPGIPAAEREARGRAGHWGLRGMYERAAKIGARLTLDSPPGGGARVTVTLPAALAYRRRLWRWPSLRRPRGGDSPRA